MFEGRAHNFATLWRGEGPRRLGLSVALLPGRELRTAGHSGPGHEDKLRADRKAKLARRLSPCHNET